MLELSYQYVAPELRFLLPSRVTICRRMIDTQTFRRPNDAMFAVGYVFQAEGLSCLIVIIGTV
jgi:hypothetical protein